MLIDFRVLLDTFFVCPSDVGMLRQIFCAPQNFFHFEPATMTMKLLVVASAIASAAAFAPAGGSQKVSTALDATRAVAAAKPKPKAKPVRATKAIKKGEVSE